MNYEDKLQELIKNISQALNDEISTKEDIGKKNKPYGEYN